MALLTNSGGTNIADVDANSRLKVQPPTDGTNAGAMFLVGKPDLNSASNTGSITGSSQGLLGTAQVLIDFDKNFASSTSAISSSELLFSNSTMAAVWAQSLITLNTSSSLSINAGAMFRTYRFFKADQGSDRVFGVRAKLEIAPVTGNITEIGGFYAASSTTAPFFGAFFRYGSDGTLKGIVINQSGAESATAALTTTPTDFHDYVIVIGRSSVTFFIDELPVASIAAAVDSAGVIGGGSFPIAFRTWNVNNTASAQKLTVARYVAATMGGTRGQDIQYISALQGDVGIQTVNGVAVGGQTANWTNNTVPATATLSNTSPGYTTMGGNFLFVATAAAETDFALFAYQVPQGSSPNSISRTLIVRGITIDAYVSAAGGTPTVASVLHWGFGVSGTAVSLATAESTTAKQARRGFLGIQSILIGAVAGTELRRISHTFGQPMAVNPGEFLHIILRIPLGAATTYPTIRGGVYVDASWE